MASLLNNPGCATNVGNTGVASCDNQMGVVKSVILTDTSYRITTADLAALETALTADIYATGTSRIFPIKTFVGVEDTTEAAVIATTQYGVKVKQKDEVPSYNFDLLSGVGLAKNLKKFDNRVMRAIMIDEAGNIWGTNVGSDFAGFTVRVAVSLPKPSNGADANVLKLGLSSEDSGEYADIAFIAPDFDASDLSGLLDLELYVVSQSGATVNIRVRENISKTSIGAAYESILETAANWAVTKVTDGTSVTVTSSTYNAASDMFAVLLSLVDDTSVNIALDSAADLKTAGLVGYESISVTVAIDIP